MNEHTEAALNTKWYTVANDLIGGYAVSTVNYPLSSGLYSNREYVFDDEDQRGFVPAIAVADCHDSDIADHIVGLHNDRREHPDIEHELAEAKSEIERHHHDFERIRTVIYADHMAYPEMLRRLRNIVG